MKVEKHFVEFLSPGTFVSESTTKEIDTWDISVAKKMASNIVERYNAKPYGFRFITRSRKDHELDSEITKTSGIHYLGGNVLTLAQVKARNNPKDAILISNMECNGYDKVIENSNSFLITLPFRDKDMVV